MASVHLVEDLAKPGRRLALKLLREDGGKDLGFQFQREFLCMTRLRHPNIVEVYDFGITNTGASYFTMEYVDGRSLTELPADAPFDTLHAVFSAILETLAFIHGRGVLHRDLKPQNLLWALDDKGLRVKVTDFGLAESVQPEGDVQRLGTVLYTPPEVACGMKADQRSDLYSLGVVLYEVLSGRPPFVGDDPVEVLRQHLDAEPPPLVPRNSVPAGLLAIVHKLLSKRRGERFSSADEVLRALDDLAPGDRKRSSGTAAAVLTGDFFGRDQEMARLSDALGLAHSGRGRTVLVGGEAGSGKSRLLREFRSICQVVGLNVAWASCQGRAAHPFQPLADLVGQLGLRPGDAGRFGLEELFDGARHGVGQERERHSGLVDGLVAFLKERSRPGAPVILILEELHEAQEAALDAIRVLCGAIEQVSVVLVGSYLHEAVYSSYVWEDRSALGQLIGELSGLESFSEMVLPRLRAEEVASMISSMLGQSSLPDGLLEMAMEEAEGNPFVVEELMKALIAGEALVRRWDGEASDSTGTSGLGGWILEPARLKQLTLPTTVRAIFEKRLELCSGAARSLAELCSVLGRRVEYSVLEELWTSGVGRTTETRSVANGVAKGRGQGLEDRPDPGIGGPERLAEAVDELLRVEVLAAQEHGGRTSYGLAHNKLREVLYGGISSDRRSELHGQIARYLEQRHATQLEDVAGELEHHFAQVGDDAKVRVYARLAAAAAKRGFAYERAVEALEHCRRSTSDPREDLKLTLEIAELCSLTGQLEKAERLYGEALGAEGPVEDEMRAELFCKLGEIHHRRGAFRQAIERFEEALNTVPDAANGVASRCLANLADSHLALGRLAESREFCRRALDASGDGMARARALEILGKAAWAHHEQEEARRCFTEVLELRQKAGDSLGVGHAYAQLGIVADLEREPESALELFHKALEIYETTRFLRGQAEVYRSLGLLHHRHKVAWELAQDCFARSLAILERLGNEYEAGRTLFCMARLCEDRGQFDRANELYLRDLAIVNLVKDYAAIGQVLLRLGNVCVLRAENVKAEFYLSQAQAKLEKAGAAGERLQALAWALRCVCSIENGDLIQARERLEKALSLLGATSAGPLRGYVWLIEAQLLRAEGRIEEADQRIEEGYDILRTRGTTFDRAFANLVRGRHAMLVGRDEEALRWLEHAREIFEKTGSKSFLQEVRGRITGIGEKQLQTALGDKPGAGDIATLYQISQIFNSTLELKELLDRVMKVVMHQIHAERGYLIVHEEVSGEWRARSVAHANPSAEEVAALLSSGLIESVVSSGRPILAADAASDPRFAGNVPLKLFDVKSILCTPLRVHDRVFGVIYLDHRSERGQFSERDLEFLRLLATHASRAIENALLYENYRSTMNSLSAGIIALNPQGALVACNRMAEELLGGKLATLFDSRSGPSASRLAALAGRVLEERENVEEIVQLELGPRTTGRLHVRMKRLHDGRGGVLGALCFLRDVTMLERLKEQVSRESRLSAMGELATKIAGRMKSFFSGIRILGQGLGRQLGVDHRAEYVQEILLELEEAERYVTENLSPKTGQDAWQSADMGRFLHETLQSLEPELSSRGITLRRDLPSDAPALTIQPLELREALVNLCRNAMQAIGSGGTVDVRAHRRELATGRRSFSIAVQDNGPGITPEHRARIFDPFFTTKEDGHGVGLWMVHNVVKSHGGTIDLETEVGVGTTFTIHLPM